MTANTLLSPKQVVKLATERGIEISENWLMRRRTTGGPIPYRKVAGKVRYLLSDVEAGFIEIIGPGFRCTADEFEHRRKLMEKLVRG